MASSINCTLFFFKTNVFLVVLGLHFCMGFSLNCGDWGPLSSCGAWLLIAVVTLVAEARL